MNLGQIVEEIKDILLEIPENTASEILSLCCDSRKVVPGSLFVAVKGTQFDGDDFIDEAIRKGAVAIVSESSLSFSIPSLKTSNSYEALARIAEFLQGKPAASMNLIGVTGTNGKSSTVYILDAILREAGIRTGMIGTLGNRIADTQEPADLTTPDALSLQSLFLKMKKAQVHTVSMEVSSHALSQYRTGSIPFKTAIFTNLTQDHLDYHGSMENYFTAKKKLFDEFLHERGKAVINIDDEYGSVLAESFSKKQVFTLGFKEGADYRIVDVKYSRIGSSFKIVSDKDSLLLEMKLAGEFNIYNAGLAAVAALVNGIDKETIITALKNFPGVPGRLEMFTNERGLRVFVDYAHTPDALENVLNALEGLGNRILCIFGCGGDRDKTKRPLMAKIAEENAHEVWITDDNPRTEDPLEILEDIKSGFTSLKNVHEQPDRYKCILEAIEYMTPEDVLVVAGKGHEDYQIYGKEKRPFCDRKTVKEILENMSA